MPENSKYVGRPTKYGNPMKLVGNVIYIDAGYRRKLLDKWVYLRVGDLEDMLHLFGHIVRGTNFVNKDLQYWSDRFKELDYEELRGFDLACWCSLSDPCHVDIIINLCDRKFKIA